MGMVLAKFLSSLPVAWGSRTVDNLQRMGNDNGENRWMMQWEEDRLRELKELVDPICRRIIRREVDAE